MARRSVNIFLDRTNQSLCDLEIIAGNETGEDDDDSETGRASPILATKVFLYGLSDKWKELIQSARKTMTKDADSFRDKIFIPQIQREIMENIIDFVYAGLRNEIHSLPLDDQNVGKYFEAAQFLEMEDVEAECLQYFDSKVITLENFSVLFKWSSTFGKEAIQPKMRIFLKQHSKQIPEIIGRCKNDLNIPEAEIALILIEWLSFCSSKGKNISLSVKKVIRQFSDKNEKIKLLDAFFEAGDSDWSKTAFTLIRNLYKNGDQDSDSNEDSNSEDRENVEEDSNCFSDSTSSQHEIENPTDSDEPDEQSPQPHKKDSRGSVKLATKKSPFNSTARKCAPATGTISHPPKSKPKSTSFSRAPSKRTSSQSGPNSNTNKNFSDCQPTSTPKASPPGKKRKVGNNSTKSKLNSAFVQLERMDASEQQEQEEQPVENDDSSSSSSSSNSSSDASTVQRKQTFDKNNKLAQNSSAQGIFYFLLKNQNSPGGFHFWSFDFKTKKSVKEAQLPPSFRDRRNLAMVYWKKTIYFMGGESSRTKQMTNEVYAFDLNSREWTKMDMIDPRFDFGACVLNGNIYAVGGCEESPSGVKSPGVGINTVEILSLASSRKRAAGGQIKWEEVDCMESCRAHAGIVALDGKIYAIGGEVWNQKVGKLMSASELCEVFDPKIRQPQDQWNPIAPMKYKRLGLAAVTTTEPHPNRIYALGGTLKNPHAKKSADSRPLNIVEIYDPDEDSWKTGPPMKKPRKFFSAVYSKNCIYALGGDSETQPTMEKFDLRTKKWTLEGDLKKEANFETVAFESL